MDLQTIKNKAIWLKNKAIDASSKKLAESRFTINNLDTLNTFIQRSKNTSFTDVETGKIKHFAKKTFVLFWDEKTEFFKQALYILPILATKWYSQNIPVKLAKSNIQKLDLKQYNIDKLPSLVVFENLKVNKVISGEENILKLVKKVNLNINSSIEEL